MKPSRHHSDAAPRDSSTSINSTSSHDQRADSPDVQDPVSVVPRYTPNPSALFPRPADRASDPNTRGPNFELSSNTLLSERGRDFVISVRTGDYVACRRFLRQDSRVLDEHNLFPNFGKEAINALVSGEDKYARSCIEKALICYDLSSRDDDERDTYLQKLATKDLKLVEYLEQAFERAWANVQKQSKTKGKAPVREQRRSNTRRDSFSSSGNRPAIVSWAPNVDNKAKVRHSAELPLRPSGTVDTGKGPTEPRSAEMDKKGRRHDLLQVPEGAQVLPADDRKSDRHDLKSVRDPKGIPLKEAHDTARPPTIRGTDGQEDDEIDERFHKRFGKEAKEFWCMFRVFALIWHSEDNGNATVDDDSEWLTKNKKGQMIRSHVTRMAVVRVGAGFVWAIPISTYGKRGVSKFNKKELIDTHAIIHSAGRRPEFASQNEPFMQKKPIAVDMAPGQSSLHYASRIDFAKVQTVEWNVRAMRVGTISSKSRVLFNQYWDETLGR